MDSATEFLAVLQKADEAEPFKLDCIARCWEGIFFLRIMASAVILSTERVVASPLLNFVIILTHLCMQHKFNYSGRDGTSVWNWPCDRQVGELGSRGKQKILPKQRPFRVKQHQKKVQPGPIHPTVHRQRPTGPQRQQPHAPIISILL